MNLNVLTLPELHVVIACSCALLPSSTFLTMEIILKSLCDHEDVLFFVKQGTIYTHNRICKSVIFMWYYGDPLGYSCKIWSCQYFDNPTHQCVAWYRQGLTADNQPKTLFMTFEVVISHEQKKTKRNFTSHSWNCDDAKGRIQNEWYIGSSSLGFFCHSTDMKTTVCQNGNLFWVQQSKIFTWKCPILSVLFSLTANIQISMLLSNLKHRWHQCLYSKLKRKLCHREPAMVNNELFGLFELKISDIFSLYT